jgi:hypothetical protein
MDNVQKHNTCIFKKRIIRKRGKKDRILQAEIFKIDSHKSE